LSNGITDTLESSSVLIYSYLYTGLYTQKMGLDAILIKWQLKKVAWWVAAEL